MEPKHLTPTEAWDDFYSNFTNGRAEGVPMEIRVAQATRLGHTRQPSGTVKVLGARRIQRLLDAYAPGQYSFHDGEPYFTKS